MEDLAQDPEGRAFLVKHIPQQGKGRQKLALLQGKGRQKLALAWLSWGLQREVTLDDLEEIAASG